MKKLSLILAVLVFMTGCAGISFNVDDSYFKHNPKRHRVSKDIVVPADKGLHQRLLNLFKVKSFRKYLSELTHN